MRYSLFVAASAATLILAACGQKPAANDGVDEKTAVTAEASALAEATAAAAKDETMTDAASGTATPDPAVNLAAAKAFLETNALKDGVSVTDSGLQYEVISEGPADGVAPKASDIVDVHYVGTLLDGTEFDSSRARGAPARFPLNRVIKGWTEGVQLMSEGDRFRFFIPPELAYGQRGAGDAIGPNEALVFDVELLTVVSAERNLAKAEAFLAENKSKEGVKVTETGLQYLPLSEGPEGGARPSATSTVKVHYKGDLLNGTEFDSSYARGEPIEFPLDAVIPGWTEGLQLMTAGDKYRFFIHPALAYGENPRPGGAIGPNDLLVFEVELIEVK